MTDETTTQPVAPETEIPPVPGAAEEAPRPGPGEGRPDLPEEVIRDAKRRMDAFVIKRETAINSLNKAIQTAQAMNQQALVLRGRIAVYEEQITEIEQKYGIKAKIQ